MDTINYPLEELSQIKNKRFEQAIKVLEQKKIALQRELDILKKVELERDKVFKHKEAKLKQLRQSLDEGEKTDEIIKKKQYLEVVKEELLVKEKKVKDQQKNVQEAEKELEIARKDLLAKQKDVEKLKIHRAQWEREMRYVEAQKIQNIEDEIGAAKHILKKKERKRN
ncbi:MAG: type III secretion T3S chaperone [Parachlamydiales bacterium]|nr:type III secretion T3S chaperone [Parachlamydiales bacterium]